MKWKCKDLDDFLSILSDTDSLQLSNNYTALFINGNEVYNKNETISDSIIDEMLFLLKTNNKHNIKY